MDDIKSNYTINTRMNIPKAYGMLSGVIKAIESCGEIDTEILLRSLKKIEQLLKQEHEVRLKQL